MAPKLATWVESLEGIDESIQPLYAEKTNADGQDGFGLTIEVEGMIPATELDGLKTNRDEILTEHRKLKEKFKGVDLEKYRNLVKTEKDLAREKAEAKGDFAALEAQLREGFDAEISTRDETNSKYRGIIRDLMVTQVATKEIADAKGKVGVLLPHIQNAVRCVEENEGSGDFVVQVLGADGRQRLAGKGEPMTIRELVGEMKDSEDFSILFDGEGATGGGSTGTQVRNSGAVVLRGEDRKDPIKYKAAKAQAAKLGVPLQMLD